MGKGITIAGLAAALASLVVTSYVLYTKDLTNYLIVSGTMSGIVAFLLGSEIISNRSEESKYKSKLKQILKTYDSVLVRCKNLPNLEEKNVIKVESIEDLVDAQMELRKPIYYQEQSESCSFILLDNTEANVFILKQNEDVLCQLEIVLDDLKILNRKNKSNELTDEILKDIERTTIVRVNKNKYVKVSPIRKKKEKVEETSNEQQIQQQEQKSENKVEEVKQDVEQQVQVEEPKVEVQEQQVQVEEPKVEVQEQQVQIEEQEIQESVAEVSENENQIEEPQIQFNEAIRGTEETAEQIVENSVEIQADQTDVEEQKERITREIEVLDL